MMRSGYDWLKSHVLRCWRNDVNDWADVVSSGRAFQMRGAATGKSRLPTVESLTEGTEKAQKKNWFQCWTTQGDWCRQNAITMNSVKNRNHAVMSFLADRTAACITIGYHSNSWASCFHCWFCFIVADRRCLLRPKLLILQKNTAQKKTDFNAEQHFLILYLIQSALAVHGADL